MAANSYPGGGAMDARVNSIIAGRRRTADISAQQEDQAVQNAVQARQNALSRHQQAWLQGTGLVIDAAKTAAGLGVLDAATKGLGFGAITPQGQMLEQRKIEYEDQKAQAAQNLGLQKAQLGLEGLKTGMSVLDMIEKRKQANTVNWLTSGSEHQASLDALSAQDKSIVNDAMAGDPIMRQVALERNLVQYMPRQDQDRMMLRSIQSKLNGDVGEGIPADIKSTMLEDINSRIAAIDSRPIPSLTGSLSAPKDIARRVTSLPASMSQEGAYINGRTGQIERVPLSEVEKAKMTTDAKVREVQERARIDAPKIVNDALEPRRKLVMEQYGKMLTNLGPNGADAANKFLANQEEAIRQEEVAMYAYYGAEHPQVAYQRMQKEAADAAALARQQQNGQLQPANQTLTQPQTQQPKPTASISRQLLSNQDQLNSAFKATSGQGAAKSHIANVASSGGNSVVPGAVQSVASTAGLSKAMAPILTKRDYPVVKSDQELNKLDPGVVFRDFRGGKNGALMTKR